MKRLGNWLPQDIITVLVVIVCGILLIMGIDGTVAKTLLAVVVVYYGIDLTPFVKLGRVQKLKKEE